MSAEARTQHVESRRRGQNRLGRWGERVIRIGGTKRRVETDRKEK
jgi:hypothetical protein